MADLSTPELILHEITGEGVERIRRFIGESEDLYLDFLTKRDAASTALHIDDERNYARAVSGYGNSDGGLLVWGIRAQKDPAVPESMDVARALVPIDDIGALVSRLNKLIPTITKPSVPGVRNIPIPDAPGGSLGYVVSYIPVGSAPPYRAEKDVHRYYKRSGDSFVEMEPYEVRDVTFRFQYPKVHIEIGSRAEKKTPEEHIYSLIVALKNLGPTTLRNFVFAISYPEEMEIERGAWALYPTAHEQRHGVKYITRTLRAIGDGPAIFPEEERIIIGNLGPHVTGRDPPGGHAILEYKINRGLLDRGFDEKPFYWRLYGDNMPPQSGEVPITELTNF